MRRREWRDNLGMCATSQGTKCSLGIAWKQGKVPSCLCVCILCRFQSVLYEWQHMITDTALRVGTETAPTETSASEADNVTQFPETVTPYVPTIERCPILVFEIHKQESCLACCLMSLLAVFII